MSDGPTHPHLRSTALSTVTRALSGSPEATLAPARAQADRLVMVLLSFFAVCSLGMAALNSTWLVAAVVGPSLCLTFWTLHRLRPGSPATRYGAGACLQLMVAVLIWQGGGRDEPQLLFFLAATALIAYQDWRCLWPGTLLLIVLLEGLAEMPGLADIGGPFDHEENELGHRLIHFAVLLAHTGMCSACAGLLGGRTLHAAAITADLERARRDLSRALAVRERTERDLVEARDRAESLARTKADFLATMSHELRTPMNGILGMSRLLAETELDAEQKEILDAVLVSGDALLDIIGDVLDYSKMEAGRLTIDPTACDLRRVCEAVLDIIAPKADEKDLALVLRFRPGAPRRVIADAARLRQILLNLMGNAVKFTASGRVHLEISPCGGQRLRFAVIDSGIGITVDQRTRLFQPFVQAEEVTTRTYGGTGLGLAISKRLVELMHGTIGVDSDPGQGSTFWFELPLPVDDVSEAVPLASGLAGKSILVLDRDTERGSALCELLATAGVRATLADTPPTRLDGQFAVLVDDSVPGAVDLLNSWSGLALTARRLLIGGKHVTRGATLPGVSVLRKPVHADALFELLLPGGTRRHQPRTPAPEVPPVPTRGLVLVADDHYVSLHQTEQMLRAAGFDVVTAVDGVQALKFASERRFQLLLIDALLPDLDAAQLIDVLRGGGGPNRKTPVVAIAGSLSGEENERYRAAGIVELLDRPLHQPALLAVLERWCT
jgi:signal transduction histidine kinase/CheY-like chemotaxis protein